MKVTEAIRILGQAGIVATLESRQANKIIFSGFTQLGQYAIGKAVFINKDISADEINQLKASLPALIITNEKIKRRLDNEIQGPAIIITDNPKAAFAVLATHSDLGQYIRLKHDGIHPTAIIDGDVMLHDNIHIGPYTVIGCEGLNIYRHKNKTYNTTHVGGVTIGARVRIGNNCTVQRAVIGNTEIGENALIAHNVMIGHGVKIGDDNVISSGAMISGSAKTGNDVYIGPGVTIKNGITIGDNSFIGVGSNVITDIPANAIAVGNPARVLEGSKRPW